MKPGYGSRVLACLAWLALAAAPAAAQEVLPWANTPPTPPGENTAAAPALDAATLEAAAQCGGLFEASCRDLKICAWIADVALQDGTLVPARCVARPPAPPKKAAKKPATKPKETTAAAPKAEAPAVKATVKSKDSESEGAAKPASQTAVTAEPAPAPTPPPVAETAPPAEKAPPPVAEKTVAPEPKDEAPVAVAEPEAAKPKAPEKKADSAKAPIVVTPPAKKSATPAAGAQMPSFGSINPIMPGGSNAVVVTVPPPQ